MTLTLSYDGTRRCALVCNGHIYSAFAAHTCIPKLFWVSHHLKYCTNTYPSQPMNPVIVADSFHGKLLNK